MKILEKSTCVIVTRPWFNKNTLDDAEWEIFPYDIKWENLFPEWEEEKIIVIADINSPFAPQLRNSSDSNSE